MNKVDAAISAAARRIQSRHADGQTQTRTIETTKVQQPLAGTSLENVPPVKDAYAKAQDATKSIEKRTPPPGRALSEGYQEFPSAPNLKDAHTAAKDATQPIEQRPQQVEVTRTVTSADRNDLKGTQLEQAPDVGQKFSAAVNDNQPNKNATQRGSSMVQSDGPSPYPKPTLPGISTVDRQAFNDKWNAERAKADQVNRAIADAAKRVAARASQRGHEYTQSRSVGI